MTQLAIDWNAANEPELKRVTSRIGKSVLFFAKMRYRVLRPEFHMQDLTNFVKTECGVAPDSPGRILRSLRQSGQIRYTVLDRSKSLYRVDWVKP